MNNIIRFIICIIVPQTIGALSGIAALKETRQWYPELVKPLMTPPNSIFAPVWLLLYFLMGIASYLVWKHGLKHTRSKKSIVDIYNSTSSE